MVDRNASLVLCGNFPVSLPLLGLESCDTLADSDDLGMSLCTPCKRTRRMIIMIIIHL